MSKKIVFYDGNCILCNGLCAFLLERLDQHDLYFASIQHSEAYQQIGHLISSDIDSVILQDGEKIYIQSDAVLELFGSMDGSWRYISLFKVMPKILRDGIYKMIARNRYRFLGRAQKCKLYSKEQRERMLS